MNAKWVAFGRELAEKRIAAGVSLEDMARATKIRRSLIEALEAGKFENLPPAVFVTGFLKAYLLHLGAEGADTLVARYQGLLAAPPEAMAREAGAAEGGAGPSRKGLWTGISVVLFLALCGIAYWIWEGFETRRVQAPAEKISKGASLESSVDAENQSHDRAEVPAVPAQAPAEDFHTQVAASLPEEHVGGAEPSSDGTPDQGQPALEIKDLNQGDLVIICDRPCWLELYEGEERKVYRLLAAGEHLAFRGKAFRANIGDTSALELYWHGRRVTLPVGDGKVMRDLPIPPRAVPEVPTP